MISRDNPQNSTHEVGTTATPILQVGMLRVQREVGRVGRRRWVRASAQAAGPGSADPLLCGPDTGAWGWCSHGGLSLCSVGRDPLAPLFQPPVSYSRYHQSHSYRSSRQTLWEYSEIQSFIPFIYIVLYTSFFQLKGRPNAYRVTA